MRREVQTRLGLKAVDIYGLSEIMGPGEKDKFVVFDTPTDGGIRMASDTIGLGEVRDRLLAETGFGNQEEHCEIYVVALADSELWDDEEYALSRRAAARAGGFW